MNRWNGTAYLIQDPELVTTNGGTDICVLRIGVKRAGRNGRDGYFDAKAFEAQARACAQYLKAGREVAIDGELLYEQWRTEDDEPRSRVYIAANRVEFLPSGSRRDGQEADNGQDADDPAAAGDGASDDDTRS